ncbi:MAG: class I SAM-dependent methyltransferase [Lautropia sp.]
MQARGQQPTNAQRTEWDDSAQGWDANTALVNQWLNSATDMMLRLAGIRGGSRVLDVAAGAGGQTTLIADRIGPTGSILATDLSGELVERLLRSLERSACAVEGIAVDAQLPLGRDNAFDAAVCRLGLMLMPQPERCIAATYAALEPGARFCAMVFAGPESNPCIRILMATALRHAGLPPRDPFAPGGLLSLGRAGHLDLLFQNAGFAEASTIVVDAPFPAGSVDEYMTFIRSAAAPIRAILAKLDQDAREAAWTDIRSQLDQFSKPGGWSGPNTLLLTTGCK